MTTASDIEAAAADWLVRLDGLGADALPAEFIAWCECDPRHRAAYLRLEAAWKKADRLGHLRAFDQPVDADLLASSSHAPQPRGAASFLAAGCRQGRAARWLAPIPGLWPIAAALAAFAIGLSVWVLDQGGEVYRTGIGGFERIVLEDGSAVELNTRTEIRVRFSSDARQVSLVRGQAHFKVAHDARRPFDVVAGAARVRAIGTAFSVRLRDRDEVEVLVSQGRVAIATQDFDPSSAGLSRSPPTLDAGEVAFIKPSMPTLETKRIEAADLSRQLAWTEGRLVFEGQTLREAVAEFNRYNKRQLAIADPTIADLRVGGSFEATDPDSFVVALEKSFGVRASGADRDVIALVRSIE